MSQTASPKLTPKQQQLYDAIRDGARLTYRGWQEIGVDYGPQDPRNYVARETTAYALRDRGLIVMDKDGIRIAEVQS